MLDSKYYNGIMEQFVTLKRPLNVDVLQIETKTRLILGALPNDKNTTTKLVTT